MSEPAEDRGTRQRERPGRLGYAVAAALLLTASIPFLLVVRRTSAEVEDRVRGFHRFVVPGTHTLDLQPGPLTLFYEKRSVIGGETFATSLNFPQQLAITLTDPKGQAVPLATSTEVQVLAREPFHGHSLASLEVAEPGTYTLTAGPSDLPGRLNVLAPTQQLRENPRFADPQQRRVLSLGHLPMVDLLKGGFTGVYGAAVLLGFAATAAAVIGIITWMRRHTPRLGERD